jgi:enoyl-CoA hydratase/carnithine racemase
MPVQPIETGDVLVAVEGPIVTATLNRPSKLNALTQEMYRVLADTVLAAAADPQVAAVVVTGNDRAFSAGNDLVDFTSGQGLDQAVRFLEAIASVDVPLVAAVRGSAIGVGLTMLLHFDLVYVEPTASLAVPFVGLGLVPEAGSSILLPKAVGERHAADLLLTGRTIDGTTAAEWGLANAAVSPALDAALEAAGRLALQPPVALRATKALVRSPQTTLAEQMTDEMTQLVKALGEAEFAEAIAARREKRAPDFRR